MKENYIMSSLMICTFIQNSAGDKIGKNEMDGACSAYGGEQRCIKSFGGVT